MEPFTPFAYPYANGLSSWRHGEHLERSFHGDSGYASDDSDIVPIPVLDSYHVYEDIDHVDHHSARTQLHPGAALVQAQWSRPVPSRAYHPLHNPFDDSRRPYDLPQQLAFEQELNDYEPDPRLRPSAFYNRPNLGREPSYTASQWRFEENISPLAFEEHRARIPDALPSLNNRIESETDLSSLFPNSSRHGCSSPEAKTKAPQSRSSTTSTQPGHKAKHSTRSSVRHQGQNQPSSRDAQLAAAWQQLYQDRTELEKERRAIKKKEKSLLQRKERPHSSRRGTLGDVSAEGSSGGHKADESAG